MGLGPQVNKFEQVSSNDYQMLVAEGGYPRGGIPGPMSGGKGVHYHVSYPIMHVMLPPPVNRHTSVKTLPFRNCCGRY